MGLVGLSCGERVHVFWVLGWEGLCFFGAWVQSVGFGAPGFGVEGSGGLGFREGLMILGLGVFKV